VRTPDFKRTLEFLRDALGMLVTAVPEHESNDKAAWAYDHTGVPVLHLASAEVAYSPDEVLPDEPPRGSGAIHLAGAQFPRGLTKPRRCRVQP
jgi:hypothetical protein